MPTHKTKIFNSAIDINYENKDKDKLLQLIENLNVRLKKYNHLSGQVSDSKIIILAALAIEDDLMEKNKLILKQNSISNDLSVKKLEIDKLSSEIISLKEKIYLLETKLDEKNKTEFIIEEQIEVINKQLENLNKFILSIYDE